MFGIILGSVIVLAALGVLIRLVLIRLGRSWHVATVKERYAYVGGTQVVDLAEIEASRNPIHCVLLDFGTSVGMFECGCSKKVFMRCQKGLIGVVEIKGNWLLSISPYDPNRLHRVGLNKP